MTTISAAGQVTENGSALHIAGRTAPAESLPVRAEAGAKSTVRPSVSLVIPVRNEARNIASVLEQVADDVDEIILVDGNSTDVTVITALAYRPDVRVVPQQGTERAAHCAPGSRPPPATSSS